MRPWPFPKGRHIDCIVYTPKGKCSPLGCRGGGRWAWEERGEGVGWWAVLRGGPLCGLRSLRVGLDLGALAGPRAASVRVAPHEPPELKSFCSEKVGFSSCSASKQASSFIWSPKTPHGRENPGAAPHADQQPVLLTGWVPASAQGSSGCEMREKEHQAAVTKPETDLV